MMEDLFSGNNKSSSSRSASSIVIVAHHFYRRRRRHRRCRLKGLFAWKLLYFFLGLTFKFAKRRDRLNLKKQKPKLKRKERKVK
jgi:hypothetical protein